MSRLHDFDEFLRTKKATEETVLTTRQQQLIDARTQHDELLIASFNLLKEFHERIIIPRTKSFIVLKKDEEIAAAMNEPLQFIYKANIIPTDFLPPGFAQTDLVQRVEYLQPQVITPHDWHANVAMQFTLTFTYNAEKEMVLLDAFVTSWGHLQPETDAVISNNITFTHEYMRQTPYTETTLHGESLPSEHFLNELEDLLIMVTPSVLTHRDTVWKK